MQEATIGTRERKFKIKVVKNTKGNYSWQAVVRADTIDELMDNIVEVQKKIEIKIEGWKGLK